MSIPDEIIPDQIIPGKTYRTCTDCEDKLELISEHWRFKNEAKNQFQSICKPCAQERDRRTTGKHGAILRIKHIVADELPLADQRIYPDASEITEPAGKYAPSFIKKANGGYKYVMPKRPEESNDR